jgi:hypothetical protein
MRRRGLLGDVWVFVGGDGWLSALHWRLAVCFLGGSERVPPYHDNLVLLLHTAWLDIGGETQ